MNHSGSLSRAAVVLAVLLLLGLAGSPPVLAGTYTIYPAADSYVDSLNPTTNYGTETQLYATYYPVYSDTTSLTQRAFLKFDLSVIPRGYIITAATLNLYVTSNGGHQDQGVTNLYHVGDAWTETGVTWNNQPPAGSYLASHDYMFWGSYYAWNLFDSRQWNYSQDLAKNQISLMLKMADEGVATEMDGYSFNSRKHADFKPYLEVMAIPGSIPSTQMLLNQ